MLIDEPGSEQIHELATGAIDLATSELAYVEAHSALARMRAQKYLKPARRRIAIEQLEDLWTEIAVVEVEGVIISRAVQLIDAHALRAYDAVQLASALAVGLERDLEFACWDPELRKVAESEGLEVVPA